MPSLPRPDAAQMESSARWLVLTMLLLMGFGLVMVGSASATPELARGGGLSTLPGHLSKLGVALGAFLLAGRVTPRLLQRLAPWLWGGAVALLLAVLLVGVEVNGARRWLDVGFTRLQPSEIARVATVIMLGAWAASRGERMGRLVDGVLLPFALAGVPALLVLLEPDFGSTVYLFFMAFLALLVGGARPRHLLGTFLVALLTASVYGWERLGHVSRRLREYAEPAPGSQVWESLVALGSGGWTGVGLGQGRAGWGYVPEAENDFILAVIGEELGLAGTLALLLLYGLFLLHGLRLLLGLKDPFALVVGAGLLFQVLVQALLNVAVVTGAAPPKGLPLPFVSAGGTSLLVLAASVGLLLGLARSATQDRGADTRWALGPEG